ncbi:MAG: hypothetical protein GTO45_06750 [Candidatus Aminicenantes bacterium]|nr:hypothetical protein [Candidatus Aminicenantes bacterium]NIN17786.1 hypothetical protein [Candidatus Aminicenantes bacterium]NIN84437.1 hypothetical protein [Candidatus Aminicenantes bacterium]NIO80589.1 hypothetical protein [Candidatus Aminicenantes bacterium]NIQ66453.1 hypothetical protein [Candidatus Aminicenantes bacterium]
MLIRKNFRQLFFAQDSPLKAIGEVAVKDEESKKATGHFVPLRVLRGYNLCLRRPGGSFEKPHCVGEHLQCKDGVQRFKRHIVSMDIP